MTFRFPNTTHRTTIIGRTGSGKTTAALWLLSEMNWTRRPWIIIDYKRQDFDDIPGIQYHKLTAAPPRKAGLYLVQPMPTAEDNLRVEELFWKIWKRGKIGVVVDEGYLTPRGESFSALLVTGRSKQVPMIINTQRPVWVPPHIWSESNFFMVFHLNHRKDERTVEEFTPFDLTNDLPPYYSRWYDVGEHQTHILKPVPDRDTVMDRFAEREREKRGKKWTAYISPGLSRTGLRFS